MPWIYLSLPIDDKTTEALKSRQVFQVADFSVAKSANSGQQRVNFKYRKEAGV